MEYKIGYYNIFKIANKYREGVDTAGNPYSSG